MRLSALIFMAAAWIFVIGLTTWSFRKLLSTPQEEKLPPPRDFSTWAKARWKSHVETLQRTDPPIHTDYRRLVAKASAAKARDRLLGPCVAGRPLRERLEEHAKASPQ